MIIVFSAAIFDAPLTIDYAWVGSWLRSGLCPGWSEGEKMLPQWNTTNWSSSSFSFCYLTSSSCQLILLLGHQPALFKLLLHHIRFLSPLYTFVDKCVWLLRDYPYRRRCSLACCSHTSYHCGLVLLNITLAFKIQ